MNALLERLARPEILAMTAYSSARKEMGRMKVHLDANENPYDQQTPGKLNRYPEPQPPLLLEFFSNLYSVSIQQLLLTRGSDEGIDLLIRVFCTAYQDKILNCPPTYGMYEVAATIQGVKTIQVPLRNKNFTLDDKAIVKACDSSIKLIFICSPNNPTGNLLDKNSILNICDQLSEKALVVVDEAYLEFAAASSLSEKIDEYPNLIVLRTLSKAYGLAGVRCGVVIAQPMVIALLNKIIAPYPIPTPVCQAVLSANLEIIKNNIAEIIAERDALYQFLKKLDYVEYVWKSDANFLLMKVKDSNKILQYCYQQGIAIRNRSHLENLQNCLRISIGMPEQNKLLKEVLSDVTA